MNGGYPSRDLLILVADLDMDQTFRGILERNQALDISNINFDIRRHPRRDSGCRTGAVDFLRSFLRTYRHALVVFDRHGSGSMDAREVLRDEVEAGLRNNGWEGRARAIVIDPELETWVWSNSEVIPEVLGWNGNLASLRQWLRDQGYWPTDTNKPPDPKAAMKRVMYKTRTRRSSRKFYELATRVSLVRCQDPAFHDLRTTLQTWFPVEIE